MEDEAYISEERDGLLHGSLQPISRNLSSSSVKYMQLYWYPVHWMIVHKLMKTKKQYFRKKVVPIITKGPYKNQKQITHGIHGKALLQQAKENLIGSMNPTRFGLKMAKNTPPDNGLFKNLLKNQIRELEKQLTENNFLNSSLISQQLSSLLNPRTRH